MEICNKALIDSILYIVIRKIQETTDDAKNTNCRR